MAEPIATTRAKAILAQMLQGPAAGPAVPQSISLPVPMRPMPPEQNLGPLPAQNAPPMPPAQNLGPLPPQNAAPMPVMPAVTATAQAPQAAPVVPPMPPSIPIAAPAVPTLGGVTQDVLKAANQLQQRGLLPEQWRGSFSNQYGEPR